MKGDVLGTLALTVAQVYNWRSLFVRLAIPERHAEAMTSRPLLLHGVGNFFLVGMSGDAPIP